ncbi:MAG: restriction endonuclease subunit S [Verrucomicrobiota bacterium]|jgi:type I restriction enzyme S subunit
MKWSQTTIGEFSIQKGASIDPRKHKDELFELYSIPAFDKGNPEIIQGSQIGSSKKIIQPDDVLLSRIVPHIRRAWVVGPGNGLRKIGSGEWIVFRSKKIFPRFLRWFFLWDDFHNYFMRTVSGVGGSLLRARPSEVYKIPIPIPPLSEQKRIAGILDAADALRAKRREALAQLDTLLQSTFLDMFGDPVTNPMGWEVGQLCDYTLKVGSGATPRGGDKSYTQNGVALIRSLNVRDGEFSWNKLARINDEQARRLSNVVVREDDILLNITGASVARVCRAPGAVLPARVNQHVCIIRPSDKIEPNYLEKILLVDSMKNKLIITGESGATRQAITKSQVLELGIPIPPLSLQRRFAAIVESVEKQKATMRAHLAELDTLFASLQSRAFNGEL